MTDKASANNIVIYRAIAGIFLTSITYFAYKMDTRVDKLVIDVASLERGLIVFNQGIDNLVKIENERNNLLIQLVAKTGLPIHP